MSAFIETLLRLKARAEQELNSSTSDTLPNPVAGIVGPEELHYNPLRNLPGVGGAINLGANAALHGAGLVTEGAGEAAKGLFGALTLAAAAGQRAVGDDNSEAGRDAARILEAGAGGHLGRALDTARTSEDDLVSYLAGAGEIAANPMNYANSIGALGQGLAEVGGVAGGVGKGIQGSGMLLEAANRASMLPAAIFPRVGKGLTELPEYLRDPNAAKEIAPLIAAVKDSLPDTAPRVANIGDNLETAVRAPLNADVNIPSPSGSTVQGWLERQRATGLLPEGEPGEIPKVDWARQALLKNLEAEHGQKYGRLPREAQPRQSRINVTSQTSDLATAAPDAPVPDFIKQLEQTSSTGNARGVASFPENRRIPKGAVVNDPLADFGGMQNEVLKLQDELGRVPSYDEIRYRTGSGPIQSRDLADWVAEQANPGMTEMPHPDLDRMDSLRGREAVDNLKGLIEANYTGSPEKILENLSGVRSLNSEGRVIAKDGTDDTRSLLNYLLHRGEMSKEERVAYQQGLGAKRPAAMAENLAPQAQTAVVDAPSTLRELALDPQFGGSELPGPSYFARKLGISNQEVNRGLAQLAEEGALKPLNKWYGLAPDAPVADNARAAWQRDYVGQSKAGTDILSTDVAGSELGQADLNAMSPADRMAALRKLTETPAATNPVDDLFGTAAEQASTAPKGGNNGIQFQPTRLGVTGSGAFLGAAAGGLLADDADGDPKDNIGGALGGALTGAALGAGLTTPGGRRHLEFAGNLGREALKKQGDAFVTGDTSINWQNISGQWSAQTVENVRNLGQEMVSSLPMLLDKKGSLSAKEAVAVVAENAASVLDFYNAGARDAEALLPGRVKGALSAWGLKDAKTGKLAVPDLGVDGFMEATGRVAENLNPIRSGIIEAFLPSLTPLGSVPVLGNVLGFAKGFTAPIRKTVYTTIDGITKSSFRSAIWEVASKDAAQQAAQLFESSVLQQTGKALALPADGMFSPDNVRAALKGVPAGTAEGLVKEWEAYTRAINKTGEDAAKHAFGDFNKIDPATATRGEKIQAGFFEGAKAVLPFSGWYLRALPIAAEIASHHPAFTLATLGLLADQGRDLKEQGLPGYLVGTVPFDSKAPLIGKLADNLTGGRGGTGRVNVLNGVLPFANQALGADELGEDATLYQQVESWMGRAGFSFNPIIQGVMYAVGQDWQRPGAMSRTANLEQALPGPEGPSFLQGPLDFVRKAGGNSVSTTTPVERRIAQIVYEQTGVPINDKSNAALAAATLDPNHPITQQAEREVAQGNVAKNVASLTLPVAVTASTQLDQQIGKAKAASREAGTDQFVKQTPEQVAQDAVFQKNYPLQYLLAQQAGGATGQPDPLTRVYRGADKQGRAYQALAAWEAENAPMKYFAPTYYGAYKQELMQQLGLSPY